MRSLIKHTHSLPFDNSKCIFCYINEIENPLEAFNVLSVRIRDLMTFDDQNDLIFVLKIIIGVLNDLLSLKILIAAGIVPALSQVLCNVNQWFDKQFSSSSSDRLTFLYNCSYIRALCFHIFYFICRPIRGESNLPYDCLDINIISSAANACVDDSIFSWIDKFFAIRFLSVVSQYSVWCPIVFKHLTTRINIKRNECENQNNDNINIHPNIIQTFSSFNSPALNPGPSSLFPVTISNSIPSPFSFVSPIIPNAPSILSSVEEPQQKEAIPPPTPLHSLLQLLSTLFTQVSIYIAAATHDSKRSSSSNSDPILIPSYHINLFTLLGRLDTNAKLSLMALILPIAYQLRDIILKLISNLVQFSLYFVIICFCYYYEIHFIIVLQFILFLFFIFKST
jgi:hypothetical protein